ncbi:glycosyltransferase family 2 protein [Sulfurospirillum diekertiae]|uniref:Undecaprenyl-phosphate mannosyltransferase n=1 Tax=Sulfurospirillum diekertiae TaxID=1854492 RepID=A0A1Y0HP09_9BACT|nr:glycosyltransferase family 2 protein [Sulfurospirillum diekertiae]ARU49859.1 Undecaprenyl-phosphate mannosyltransferase [Sulfurospirillum diekertiae]ASC94650.1 Undecaprenyl-phosphate mannosyltransferase [Sulfurospirillum diekertiae]
MKKDDIVVVIPTYNNPLTIEKVAQEVLTQGYALIVVDDGSKINVADIILKPHEKLTIIRHLTNQGKGAAIMTGAHEAQKRGFDYFISLDGDGQHLASQIEKICNACDGKDQIIIGARNFEINHVPNGSKFGRWFSNFWACWDTEQSITDSLSGFRLYPTSILDLIIKTKRFDWEMEVLVKHAWKGRIIKEVSIECYYPTPEERVSHFKKFWDTAAIVMVHVKLLPWKFFLKKKYQ